MAAMASLALACPPSVSVSFSGLRPLRPVVQVAACPRLCLSRSRHGHAFPQGIRASQDEASKGNGGGASKGKGDDASKGKGDHTFKEIRDIIVEQLGVEAKQVMPETKFSDLGADSLDTVEIMMALEEKFDIQFEQEAGEKIQTVSQAVDLIKEVIAAK